MNPRQMDIFPTTDTKIKTETIYCRRCGCDTKNKVTVMPEGFFHFARLDCLSCKKFNGWQKAPHNRGGENG